MTSTDEVLIVVIVSTLLVTASISSGTALEVSATDTGHRGVVSPTTNPDIGITTAVSDRRLSLASHKERTPGAAVDSYLSSHTRSTTSIDGFEDGTFQDTWSITKNQSQANAKVTDRFAKEGSKALAFQIGESESSDFEITSNFSDDLSDGDTFSTWVYPNSSNAKLQFFVANRNGPGNAGITMTPSHEWVYQTDQVGRTTMVPDPDFDSWYKLIIRVYPSNDTVDFIIANTEGDQWTATGIPATMNFNSVWFGADDFYGNYNPYIDNITYSPISSGDAPWWNENWRYRKQVTVTERSGTDLTDYPLVFNISHNGHAQADCGDIRVVANDRLVDHAQRNCTATNVTIAVRRDIRTAGTTSFYVYYGNHTASPVGVDWNALYWGFFEDFDGYASGEIISGTDGWIDRSSGQDFKIENRSHGNNANLALGTTSHSHGVGGGNPRMKNISYPDMGFIVKAVVDLETSESLPRVGISTIADFQDPGDTAGTSIHFDSSNDGVGDDDKIEFNFFGASTGMAGTPETEAYEMAIIGYTNQTGVGRYRERRTTAWTETRLTTSFEGSLRSVRLRFWKWGGQVDQIRVRRYVAPEPSVQTGPEEIRPNQNGVVADFTIRPRSPVTNETTVFDASDSTVTSGSISEYHWAFGDGTTASGEEVPHAFSTAGTYSVTLTIRTSDGSTSQVTKTVEVTQASGGQSTPLRITNVETRFDGATLEGVSIENWYAVSILNESPIDHVDFVLDGRTRSDTTGSDGWNQSFNLGTLDGTSTLRIVVEDTQGRTATRTLQVDVIEPPEWLAFLIENGRTEIVNETTVRVTRSVPNPAIDVDYELPDIPVIGGRQEFAAEAQYGITYNLSTGAADIYGEGRLSLRILGRDGEGALGAQGVVNSVRWELERGKIWVYVQIEAFSQTWTLPVPRSPSIEVSVSPDTRLDAYLDNGPNGVSVTRGQIEPGIEASSTISLETGPFEFEGSASGSFTGSVEVPAPYDLGGSGELRATVVGEAGPFEKQYTIGPIESSIGGGTTSSTGAQVVTQVKHATAWTVKDKYGATPPRVSSSTDRSGSLTLMAATTNPSPADSRITLDNVTDKGPSLARLNHTYTTVWSRQAPNQTVLQGRELYVSQFNGSGWSAPAQLTDDRKFDLYPALAGNRTNDRGLVAWTRIDRVLSSTNTSTPADFFPAMELAVATRNRSGWSQPTLVTNDSMLDYRPAVAADNGTFIVAWTADPDANVSTQSDQAVRYMLYNGTVGPVQTIDNATHPAVATTAKGAFRLAYLKLNTSTPTNGTVTVGTVGAASTFTRTATYDTARFNDLALGPRSVMWVDGLVSQPQLYVVANGGNPSQLSLRANVTDVRNLQLMAESDIEVLTYRASPAGDSGKRLYYILRKNRTWIRQRPVGGPMDTPLTFWQASYANTDDGFMGVFIGREIGTDQTHDLFSARHGYLADLSVTADTNVTTGRNRSVGEPVQINYTIRNIGDINVSTGVTVALQNDTGTIATTTYSGVRPGTSLNGTFTASIDTSGDFTVTVDPADEVTELNESNNVVTIGLLRPDLTAAIIDQRRVNNRYRLNISVTNTGQTSARNVSLGYVFANETLRRVEIGSIDPGSRSQVSIAVPVTAINSSYTSRVQLDAADEISELDETNNRISFRALRPDVGLQADTTGFYNGTCSRGPTLVTFLSNTGLGPANVTLSIRHNNTSIATQTVDIAGSPSDAGARYRQVTISIDGIEPNETVTVIAQVPTDARPLNNIATTTVDLGTQLVNKTPVATVDIAPETPLINQTITFSATESCDPDGAIQSYAWDFDADGAAEATGKTVTYTFTKTGTHQVNLQVIDDSNATAMKTLTFNVTRYEPGDANGDGNVTAADATLIQRVIVGLPTTESIIRQAADVNDDTEITAYDVTLLLRRIVGLPIE